MEEKTLRVLLTNAYLAARAGSELYVRDIAVGLRRRGHQAIAYSTILGEVAAELRSLAVPVIEDLRDLTDPPDVIHGQHFLDAAAACLRFPGTPAVYACHGWEPWLETPVVLSSIRRYVAVSALTRDRLVTSGVPPERISVIPNFVDLDRFPHRRDPARRVKRALVYGNAWTSDAPAFHAIREACVRRGFEVEGLGYGFGRPTDQPQDVLPAFDVVFAVGRSALEAMACGCAVALAGPQGFGGLVTRQSFPQQRATNFGLAALIAGQPVTAERVENALDCYDDTDVSRVADIVRAEAGLDAAVGRWEEQYRLAAAEGPAPLAELVSDASTYLVKVKALTFHFERDYGRLAAEFARLSADAAGLRIAEDERDRMKTKLAAAESERNDALARLAAVESHNTALSSWASELHAKVTRLETPLRKRIGRKIRDAVAPRAAHP